jgi:hypothetical protein
MPAGRWLNLSEIPAYPCYNNIEYRYPEETMSYPLRRLAALLLCLAVATLAVLPLAARAPSLAADGITLSSSVAYSFPTSMTFNVSARSDTSIVELRLHYIVARQNFASVVSEGWALFSPSTSVDTGWFWDMRKGSLPPGTRVEYWWTAADAAGNTAATQRAAISFDDNRYDWQSITSDPITLYWYQGDRNFAEALMTAARQALQRIEDNTGARPEGMVRIYIYASARDLQGAELFAQPWEGGVTFTGFDVIAVGVPTSQLDYGQRAVPHELTHWIVHQVTFNYYGAGLPVWLDEGLATYGEGTLSPDYAAALEFAIENDRLISVRSLSSPFSAITQEAYISYAESNSIVTFMINEYGQEKMIDLLHVFQRGSDYDTALGQVYGFDQDGLDALWRQSLNLPATTGPSAMLVNK